MANRRKIADIAGRVLIGAVGPLTACRQIVDLIGDAEREDDDILTIRGIESETDSYPGLEQRPLWDPSALSVKDTEMEAYFEQVGPVFRVACVHLAAKWRDA